MASKISPDTEYLLEHGWRFDFDTDRWYPPARLRHLGMTDEARRHGFARDDAIELEKRVDVFATGYNHKCKTK